MKKSKLLMPLTGIAAIGAIAPVAVMTSCNKGTTPTTGEFIKHATCGNVVDATTEVMTTRLGCETLMGSATTANEYAKNLTMAVTLNDGFDVTHKIKISAEAQGKTTDPFTVEAFESTGFIEAEKLKTGVYYQTGINDLLKINPTVMKGLYDEGKEQKFEFTIKYDEYQKDGTTLVSSQSYKYEVVAAPAQHNLPTLGTWVMTGAQEKTSSKNVNITNTPFLSKAAGATLNVKLETAMEFTVGSGTTLNTLTIAAQSGVIDESTTWDEFIKATTTTAITDTTTFAMKDATQDLNVTVSFKEDVAEGEDQYYVLKDFTLTYVLPKATTVAVTKAA